VSTIFTIIAPVSCPCTVAPTPYSSGSRSRFTEPLRFCEQAKPLLYPWINQALKHRICRTSLLLPKATNLPLAGSVLTHKWLGNLSMQGTNWQPLLFRTLHSPPFTPVVKITSCIGQPQALIAECSSHRPASFDCLPFLLYQVLRPSYSHSHKFRGMILTVIVRFAYKRENGLN
jgi:hypothetical protein